MESSLVGNAGAYFVAARLSAMNLICAPTFRNTPNVDLLISDLTGSVTLSLQVKTAVWAMREQGRGNQKKPHHYEWSMSWRSARLNNANLFFALVDLRNFEQLPDVFIVPSAIISEYYKGGDPETWKWPRYHESVENLAPYKNAWDIISRHLGVTMEV